MTLVEQFESLTSRRTYYPIVQKVYSRGRSVPTNLIALNHLTEVNYSGVLAGKMIETHNKVADKFQQLRKKLASRTNNRARKMTLNTASKDPAQLEDHLNYFEITPGCSKAVVHEDYRNQELVWKKTINACGKQEGNSESTKLHLPHRSFFKSTRRLSQQIQSRQLDREAPQSKNLRIKPSRKTMDNTKMFNARLQQPWCLTKMSSKSTSRQSDADFDRIDPWEQPFQIEEFVF